MERTSNLFKKIGDIKGIYHAGVSMIKDGNGALPHPRAPVSPGEELLYAW